MTLETVLLLAAIPVVWLVVTVGVRTLVIWWWRREHEREMMP